MSLNRYLKSHTLQFHSVYQSDTAFLIIRCKDTVEDGYNGFLVPIKDSQAVADKLEILLNDKKLRQKMGRHSRQIAERDFSLEDVIAKHLAIYHEALPYP